MEYQLNGSNNKSERILKFEGGKEGKAIFRTYLRRYASEALRPGKVIDRNGVKLYVAFLLYGLVDITTRLIALHTIGQSALQIAFGR